MEILSLLVVVFVVAAVVNACKRSATLQSPRSIREEAREMAAGTAQSDEEFDFLMGMAETGDLDGFVRHNRKQ